MCRVFQYFYFISVHYVNIDCMGQRSQIEKVIFEKIVRYLSPRPYTYPLAAGRINRARSACIEPSPGAGRFEQALQNAGRVNLIHAAKRPNTIITGSIVKAPYHHKLDNVFFSNLIFLIFFHVFLCCSIVSTDPMLLIKLSKCSRPLHDKPPAHQVCR